MRSRRDIRPLRSAPPPRARGRRPPARGPARARRAATASARRGTPCRAAASAGPPRCSMSSTTSHSPGKFPRTCLSSSMTDAGQPRGVERDTCSGGGPARRPRRRLDLARARPPPRSGSNGSTVLDDERRSWPRPCGRRAADEHDRVDAERAPRTRPAPCRRRGSRPTPSRSSSVANIMGSPFARADLLGLRDDPADRHPVAVLALGELGERAVDLRAQRLAHLLERVRGDEQADRLLLDGQQLGLVELLGRDRRVRGAANGGPRRRRRRRVVAEVEDRALADLRVLLGLLPGALRLLEHRRACPCASRRSSRTRRT